MSWYVKYVLSIRLGESGNWRQVCVCVWKVCLHEIWWFGIQFLWDRSLDLSHVGKHRTRGRDFWRKLCIAMVQRCLFSWSQSSWELFSLAIMCNAMESVSQIYLGELTPIEALHIFPAQGHKGSSSSIFLTPHLECSGENCCSQKDGLLGWDAPCSHKPRGPECLRQVQLEQNTHAPVALSLHQGSLGTVLGLGLVKIQPTIGSDFWKIPRATSVYCNPKQIY